MTPVRGKRKKRGTTLRPSFPAYFVFTEALDVIVDFPLDMRTVTVFTLPAWLMDLEAFAGARFILFTSFRRDERIIWSGSSIERASATIIAHTQPIDKEETKMHNNYQGHRDNLEPKATAASEEPAVQAEPEKISVKEEPTTLFGVVTDCLRLNIRKEPKGDADVIAVITALSKVQVDTENSTEEFYKVCTETGIEGFCMKKYVALKR